MWFAVFRETVGDHDWGGGGSVDRKIAIAMIDFFLSVKDRKIALEILDVPAFRRKNTTAMKFDHSPGGWMYPPSITMQLFFSGHKTIYEVQ